MTVKLHNPNPAPEVEPEFLPFDLFFCWGPDKISRTISLATSWPLGPKAFRYGPCHVAFCAQFEHRPVWVESTMLCEHECLYRKRVVAGCQMHEISERLEDYRKAGGRVEVWRVIDDLRLNNELSGELTRSAIGKYVTKNIRYDVHGAILAGARGLKLIDFVIGGGLFPVAKGHTLFCSEWAASYAMKLNLIARANYSRCSPADLGRALATNGVIEFHRSFES